MSLPFLRIVNVPRMIPHIQVAFNSSGYNPPIQQPKFPQPAEQVAVVQQKATSTTVLHIIFRWQNGNTSRGMHQHLSSGFLYPRFYCRQHISSRYCLYPLEIATWRHMRASPRTQKGS